MIMHNKSLLMMMCSSQCFNEVMNEKYWTRVSSWWFRRY